MTALQKITFQLTHENKTFCLTFPLVKLKVTLMSDLSNPVLRPMQCNCEITIVHPHETSYLWQYLLDPIYCNGTLLNVLLSGQWTTGVRLNFSAKINQLITTAVTTDQTTIIYYLSQYRDAKRCERCERCSCKDFPTGVKILGQFCEGRCK